MEEAVVVEDSMGYMEPPRLYQPVRHCLGHVLLSDGRPAEAEQVRVISPDFRKHGPGCTFHVVTPGVCIWAAGWQPELFA